MVSCSGVRGNDIVVSVPDQRLALFNKGVIQKTYPISTSKFGLGDKSGSFKTPVGRLEVARKIGKGKAHGTVFKSRKPTGEVLKPNAPGRDPIVTRILWLRGRDSGTHSAFNRYIYIHGTPEERTLGTPSSYGCVRMSSADVAEIYDLVAVGAPVVITTQRLAVVGRMRAPRKEG